MACLRNSAEDRANIGWSRRLLFPWRAGQSQENEHRLIEPQDILVVQLPMRAPTLAFGTVVILSTIRRQAARKPLRSFGSTGSRNSGASV